AEARKEVLVKMREALSGKVKDVNAANGLRSHPVYFSTEGEGSVEMVKILQQRPDNRAIRADQILEVNVTHHVFQALEKANENGDTETVTLYTNLLYQQAKLIEGLPIEDPVAFTNDICKVMD